MLEDSVHDEFEELPQGEAVLALSTQDDVLVANLPAERLFKIKLDPGSRLTKETIFTGNCLPQASLALREAVQAGSSRSGLRGEVYSGADSTTPVEYSVFPLRNPQGSIVGLLLTFRSLDDSIHHFARGIEALDFNALFDNMAVGIFTVNYHLRITSFNNRAQKLTGYQPGEVLGRFCWEIFQSDLCQTNCPLRVTMQTGQMRTDQDVRIVDKMGQRVSILVNTSVIRDRGGKVLGAVETFRPLSGLEFQASAQAEEKGRLPTIVGQNPDLIRIMEMLPDVARSEVSVVIEGESGTGKELVARAIHEQSPRASGPFVAVNTSALAETLLESELFGHEKGAFTGASSTRAGRFELARGGTLFLDEIAEINPDIQVKLLRVLEERLFERVGGNRPITMDCRIICATNKALLEEVKKGCFRTDLYYRLHTVPITLPPLRERMDDLPMLVDHFVSRLNAKYGKDVRGVDPKALALMRKHSWPGNIRELQRVLEYAFVFIKGPIITAAQLPPLNDDFRPEQPETPRGPLSWEEERETILKALQRVGGRKQEAARILGISRSSLWRKMKEYDL